MAVIKNILFDLGNVLFSIDYKKTTQAFEQLGYKQFDGMYSQYTANALFEAIETGNITNDDFYQHLQNVNSHVNKAQIKEAWNSMLLHWRVNSVLHLAALGKKYNLYLLSNTNDIHLTAVNELLQSTLQMDNIDGYFVKAYYSHKIHLRKPHAAVFEFVLNDAKILANETLFVDDSINNIETAQQLGFKTHLLLEEELIENLVYEAY